MSTSFGAERIGIDREAVIVRGDFDALRELVDHRMIGAAMAEFQLVSLAAEREPENLMAEADAEDRRLADQPPHVVDLRVQRLGIAGAVREKHAIGLQRENVFGGSERRAPQSRCSRNARAGAECSA